MSFANLELPENRSFGLFFTFVFSLIGIYLYIEQHLYLSYVAFLVAILLLATVIINAELLTPANKLWMRLGFCIGFVVSPIILGVIFFGLVTPMSLLMKLFRRDALRIKIYTRQSYWKDYVTNSSEPSSMKNQF